MTSPRYEAYLQGPARRFLDKLSGEDAQELRRLIELIERDPGTDGEVKITVDLPPLVVSVYLHPRWWILYHIPHSGVVSIDAIAPKFPPPSWALPPR